jgi:hypothetical protein
MIGLGSAGHLIGTEDWPDAAAPSRGRDAAPPSADPLVLQEIGERGVKLHLFAIRRRSQPRYVHKDHVSRRVHDLYPEPVCTLDADLLRSQL